MEAYALVSLPVRSTTWSRRRVETGTKSEVSRTRRDRLRRSAPARSLPSSSDVYLDATYLNVRNGTPGGVSMAVIAASGRDGLRDPRPDVGVTARMRPSGAGSWSRPLARPRWCPAGDQRPARRLAARWKRCFQGAVAVVHFARNLLACLATRPTWSPNDFRHPTPRRCTRPGRVRDRPAASFPQDRPADGRRQGRRLVPPYFPRRTGKRSGRSIH